MTINSCLLFNQRFMKLRCYLQSKKKTNLSVKIRLLGKRTNRTPRVISLNGVGLLIAAQEGEENHW